jgi:hypothetical protein
MNDLLVFTLNFVIYTFVFGQIYLLWTKRLSPFLQKLIRKALSNSAFLHRKFPSIMRLLRIKRNSEI